jgi:hypothetical protein
VGIVGVGFLAIPTLAGSTAYAFRGNAGVAPGPGQELKQARWFHALNSVLYGSGSRIGLRTHKPIDCALLDRGHQWIVGTLLSRRNPGRGFGQETDAGLTEFTLGMDRCGDHRSDNVSRGGSHVLLCRLPISPPSSRTLDGIPGPELWTGWATRINFQHQTEISHQAKLIVRTVQCGPDEPVFPSLSCIHRGNEQFQRRGSSRASWKETTEYDRYHQ